MNIHRMRSGNRRKESCLYYNPGEADRQYMTEHYHKTENGAAWRRGAPAGAPQGPYFRAGSLAAAGAAGRILRDRSLPAQKAPSGFRTPSRISAAFSGHGPVRRRSWTGLPAGAGALSRFPSTAGQKKSPGAEAEVLPLPGEGFSRSEGCQILFFTAVPAMDELQDSP